VTTSVSERKWKATIHSDRQATDLRAAMKVLEGVFFVMSKGYETALPASTKFVLTMPTGVPNTQVRSNLNFVRASPRQPDHSSFAVLRFPNNAGVRVQRAQLGGAALADCFVRLR